jgi:ribosomal protein S12 methylthiotransferase
LIEEEEGGHYLGRSQFDAPEVDGLVFVKSLLPIATGQIRKIKITDTLEYDLVGEPV